MRLHCQEKARGRAVLFYTPQGTSGDTVQNLLALQGVSHQRPALESLEEMPMMHNTTKLLIAQVLLPHSPWFSLHRVLHNEKHPQRTTEIELPSVI